MNDPAKEPKPLPDILAITANVIFRDPGVICQKAIHISWFREQVRSVAQLRRLDHNDLLQVKNVLVAEEVNASCSTQELLVKERIVIRT